MPDTTNFDIPYPASTEPPNGPAQIQALAEQVDLLLTLPDPTGQGGSGSNSITLTTYSVLPTTPISCAITNPSSTHDMLVLVTISAFLASAGSGTEAQAALNATGGVSIAAGATGAPGVLALGENLLTTTGPNAQMYQSTIPVTIPAAAAAVTFALFARRSNTSNAVTLLQPAIRCIPIRFLIP